MIIADEPLDSPEVLDGIRKWYPGRVVPVTELRSGTRILDPDIPNLLRQHRGCTFVTLNWADFWQHVHPDRRFSVVCVRLPQNRDIELPGVIRSLCRHPAFATRRKRCGKVILAAAESIRYYERPGGEVREASWQ